MLLNLMALILRFFSKISLLYCIFAYLLNYWSQIVIKNPVIGKNLIERRKAITEKFIFRWLRHFSRSFFFDFAIFAFFYYLGNRKMLTSLSSFN